MDTLRQFWLQQFYAPSEDGSIQWRPPKEMPPSTLVIHSPYDLEAHHSLKRSVNWVGYKAHLTEICDEGYVRLFRAFGDQGYVGRLRFVEY